MEWLDGVLGPYFFGLFWLLFVGLLFSGSSRDSSDNSRNVDFAVYSKVEEVDPYLLSYLRDGLEGVMETALFSVWRQKLLVIEERNGEYLRTLVRRGEGEASHPLERVLLQYFDGPVLPIRFRTDPGLKEQLKKAFWASEIPLKGRALLKSEGEIEQGWRRFWGLACFVLFFGGLKWFYNLSHDFTMELLALNVLLGIALLIAYINPIGSLTRGGVRVLQRLQVAHQGARSAPLDPSRSALEPLVFVGLFGAEDLRKVPELASFPKTFAWPGKGARANPDFLD